MNVDLIFLHWPLNILRETLRMFPNLMGFEGFWRETPSPSSPSSWTSGRLADKSHMSFALSLCRSSGGEMGASYTETLQALWSPLPGLLLPGFRHHSPQRVPQPQVKDTLLSLGPDHTEMRHVASKTPGKAGQQQNSSVHLWGRASCAIRQSNDAMLILLL